MTDSRDSPQQPTFARMLMRYPISTSLVCGIFAVLTSSFLLSACASREAQDPYGIDAGEWLIAYNVLVDEAADDYDVFVMNLDGSDAKNISQHPGVDWVYVGRGQDLYVVSDRDTSHRTFFLYRMKADGSRMKRLYERPVADACPAISSNGDQLIISTWLGDGTPALLRIDTSGRELDTLLATDAFAFGSAVFAPLDSGIVFRSEESGLDELWYMPANGAWRTRWSNYPSNDASLDDPIYHTGPPRWDTAHQWVSYMSHQNGEYDIHLMTATGTWIQRLTPLGFDERWHDWSYDGHWLAYDGTPLPSDTTTVNYDIYLFDVKLKNRPAVRLTQDSRAELAPVFVRARP